MAYSVLGGAEQDFAKITASAAVARVARAHGNTHPANIAVQWVAALRVPFVVISTKPGHLRDDLQVFGEPPWGRLSESETRELSRATEPSGRPSYWADCEDEKIAVRSEELR